MAKYSARVCWKREKGESFSDQKYSRAHRWEFDGGAVIEASPSPYIVPLPYSVEAHVDPEEAFVASLSSCHMLFFLHLAAKQAFVCDVYEDNAVGELGKNIKGEMSMTKVTLKPRALFCGDRQPTLSELEDLHHQAHQACFIANSVKTQIVTEVQC